MKKIHAFAFVGILSLLTGCASSTSSLQSTASTSNEPTVTTESSVSTDTSDNKAIVVYFSGTGHTENIANMIVQDTGADTFVITPEEPYTEDDLRWTDENSRVNREHNDESLQDIAFTTTDIPDWDSYTTIFLGYPIWWQDASWVVKSFVKQVDFTGKTVIPFCTSSSSQVGDSAKNLADLAGSGDWQDGTRFSGSASEDEVKTWLSEYGF